MKTTWKKADVLSHWRTLSANRPILSHMTPIDNKARGSRYGACGIRIDGSPEFIDAVLSHLKELIDGENHVTRLGLSRNAVNGGGLGKAFENTAKNAECCYVRLHMRGGDGAIASAFSARELAEPTQRYAAAVGCD